jgi:hypothetical protein
VLSGLRLWRLSEAGPDGLGLYCCENGLFLAGTPLIEWCGIHYHARPPGEVERLLSCAYSTEFKADHVVQGLARMASALATKNPCLAQVAAVQLRLPDLPDRLARAALQAEDLRITLARLDAMLIRYLRGLFAGRRRGGRKAVAQRNADQASRQCRLCDVPAGIYERLSCG